MPTEIVEIDFPGGKRVNAQVGPFLVTTDQPEKYGGEASAPAPFDLFLASLASCAGIYALSFCQARKLATEGLDLKMVCESDDRSKMITHISLQLTLPREFPDKYRDGMIRAMEQCTVKKHIHNAPEFEISLHPAAG
ncbi:MAG: OsmC family protein [Gammaproteobacteria bacterium]|nr:OsmC family protein [Gammaproteobacteria bacterium]